MGGAVSRAAADGQLVDTAMDDLAVALRRWGITGEPAISVASAMFIAASQTSSQLGAALYRLGYIADDDQDLEAGLRLV